MANTGAVTLLGSGLGLTLGLGGSNYLFVLGSANAGATYATGGQPVTPPEGVVGKKLKGIVVLTYHDGTRLWVWDGSTSAPKLKAYDAFATEEANGTNTSGVTLQLLFIFE
jgi:hypothetical protein